MEQQKVKPMKERKGAQGHRKVKTGCRTCKVRHKKCDEGKPACSQCIAAGWPCDLIDSFIPIPGAPPHRIRTLPQPPSSIVWGATTLDPVDVWNFEYFRVVYVRKITLYLRSKLWEKLMLEAAPAERFILDGAVAIGALSRNLVPSKVSRRPVSMPGHPSGFSLHKYNLAMQELRKRLNSDSKSLEAALLGTLIFIPFELEQGRVDAARAHLDSALAILNGANGSLINDSQMRTDMAHVLNAFSDLDLQRLGMPQECPLAGLPALPSRFESINEARDSLNAINGVMNSVLQKWTHEGANLHPCPLPGLLQDLSALWSHLESWRKVFDTSDLREALGGKSEACALSLLMVYEVICITTLAFPSANETAYDAHLSRFVHITQLAKELMDTGDVGRVAALESASDPQFDLAVVQPLSFVAYKCRDPGIRRMAVCMLEKTKMGGFYNTQMQVKAANWVINTEERGATHHVLSNYVREEDRLSDLRLDVDAGAESCRVSAWRRDTDGQLCEVSDVVYAN
ncbi:hypothetical protein NW762_012138 [Fusarium torreyae]|uniref:Zn(2)-C6 fungal-type domain-containing protein n=1 Tax=Fusarium torreyae TaxID=1237075 RepID=A0A9W8VBQ9_9HYPO|nr:hypothetical protein NW762_012138 [Fusarium torreyae]